MRLPFEQPAGGHVFADVPENLPALLLARKVQRRAASAGALDIGAEEALQDLRACVEALAGDRERALAELGVAVEREERFRAAAATDEDFDSIRDDPGFPA